MQQHSRLAQPNTHVCMKLECQHLIHAAGWWLWNKLCQRVAAAKFHWAAADGGCAEVIGHRVCFINCGETFLRHKVYVVQIIFSLTSQRWCFQHRGRCCKGDSVVLGNEVIIDIQDKNAYCDRLWGENESLLLHCQHSFFWIIYVCSYIYVCVFISRTPFLYNIFFWFCIIPYISSDSS